LLLQYKSDEKLVKIQPTMQKFRITLNGGPAGRAGWRAVFPITNMNFRRASEQGGRGVREPVQAKFLTCKISDFTPCTHAQSNIPNAKYADKTYY